MIHRFGDCELDEGRFELRRGGVPRHLEPQVFEVLAYLVRNRGRLVTKAELLDGIWGSRFVSESALTSRVKAARKAVGDSGREQRLIRTVHGRGYEFLAPVEPPAGAPAPPELAGRGPELERLTGLLGQAAAGRPQVAFVTGEPGIGKTTLVEAFCGWAGGDGRATVARGQCLEQRGAPEPYLPVFDALTRLCRQDGEVVRLLGRVAPTWLVQMPALLEAVDREAVARRALGGTRERMLRQVAEALEAVAADRPLVVCLEDLHWADPSTVDLAEWLARRDTGARLLLVGTYRPADARAAGHPIDTAATDLLLRGRAVELRLGELETDAVRVLLEQRLDGGEVPEELARTVRRRTDGVPLFVAQLAQSWLDAGVLRAAAGRWELARPGGAEPEVPDDLRRLIELQLEQLDPADLTTLEAAAVGGMAFAAAVAAAGTGEPTEEVERRCAALARHGRLLRAGDPVDWPDGTVSAGFAFAHDLHRTVLYERIPAGRRARLHAAVADRLERAHGPAAAEHGTELASHFLQARDDARAVPYLQSAAEQALGRSAQLEAIQHLGALLEAVERLPQGPGRDRAELRARMTLGPALIAVEGFASPEVEGAFLRARELCGRLGDPPELPLVLHGLAAVNEFRGRYHVSEEILERLLGGGDSPLAVEAHELLACSTFHQGKAATAVGYAEAGLALYHEDRDSGYLAPYGEHPAVACHDWAALALWFLGHPDRAMAHAERALGLAREHPYSLATAEVQPTYLHQYRGERDQTLGWARQTAATATAHGFPIRTAQAAILGGWARAAAGDGDGLAALRAGLDAYLATGAELDHPYYLGLLGDAVARTSRAGEGLAVLEEAIELVGTARPFYYLPELHRLRGDLLARDGRAAEAADAYRRAMEVAAGHGTRSAELRAAVGLCRLPGRARPAEALAELRRLHGQFEEGFGTPDLLAAKALLEAS